MKTKFLKNRKFITFILFCFLFSFKSNKVEGAMWSNVATDIAIHLNNQLLIQLRISANASAKAFSIKQAQATIQSMLNNGSSKPNFITNYSDFLISSPQKYAEEGAKERLVFLLGGRIGDGYSKVNTEMSGEGVTITYEEYLYNVGNQVLEGDSSVADFMDECPDFMNKNVKLNGGIFYDGNMNCFSTMFNNISNNTPIGISIKTKDIYSQNLQNNMLVAQVQAQSSGGFLPKYDETTGDVRLPAGIVEELQKKQVTISIDALINTDSAEGINAILAILTKSVPDIITSGLGKNQEKAKNSHTRFMAGIEGISKNNFAFKLGLENLWGD